jgi:hypothetical protein
MEGEIFPQYIQENLTMVGKDVNFSCVFSVDVDEPHYLVEALNGENSQHWKKAMDSEFQSL